MTRRAALFALVFIASVGYYSPASAQTPDTVTIEVDARNPGAPLEPVWSYYGYDEVNYTTAPDGVELLRTLAEINPTPPYIRSHFLFNTGDGTPELKWGSTNIYTEDASGAPVYDYTLIDQIMDAVTEAGARPLVEIGFMPEALSTQPDPYQNSNTYVLDGGCFYPPTDYEKWGALVAAWAKHVKGRYQGAESNWQWELWNEPDIGYWQGSFEEFAQLYDTTEAALHSVFPNASLGGPAVANPNTGFLAEFLEHCETGTNSVSGETGTRLDMVSFHAKGGVTIVDDHLQMNLSNQLRLHQIGFKIVAASAAFAETPIVISEADPDGCAACPVSTAPSNAYRNSAAYGAYEVAMMKRSLELAKEESVNLRGVLTWAFTFPGSPYFAGYRALTTNGIQLPVLNAFKLLGSLRGDRLPVTSTGALPLNSILNNGVKDQPDVDALATVDDEQIQILVWNYHDDLVEAEQTPITLNVQLPSRFGANASVTHTRVDDTHGNAYTVWVAQGKPQTPSATELSELRTAMGPVVLDPKHNVAVKDGRVSFAFELPRFGLSLVTLTPASEPEVPPKSDGCSCRLAPVRMTLAWPLALSLVALLNLRRRRINTRAYRCFPPRSRRK